MKKDRLNMKEEKLFEVIKQLVESNGSKYTASLKLDVSVRHINRLIQKYNERGKYTFIHKNRGKSPASKLSDELKH